MRNAFDQLWSKALLIGSWFFHNLNPTNLNTVTRIHCGGNVWIKSSFAGRGSPMALRIATSARPSQAMREMCQHQSFQMMCWLSWHSTQHGFTTAFGPGPCWIPKQVRLYNTFFFLLMLFSLFVCLFVCLHAKPCWTGELTCFFFRHALAKILFEKAHFFWTGSFKRSCYSEMGVFCWSAPAKCKAPWIPRRMLKSIAAL